MLINCMSCGKTISTQKDICVYCKTDVSVFISELKVARTHVDIKKSTHMVKEKYAGTLLSMLLKTKVR